MAVTSKVAEIGNAAEAGLYNFKTVRIQIKQLKGCTTGRAHLAISRLARPENQSELKQAC